MGEGDIPAARNVYRIELRGQLDESWSDWCGGMAIAFTEDAGGAITTLTGPIADEAALRGLLCRLWDLNLSLISVTRTGNDPGEER